MLLVGVCFLLVSSSKSKKLKYFQETEATVTIHKGMYSYEIFYQYFINEVRYEYSESVLNRGFSPSYRFYKGGEKIYIFVNPDNPSEVVTTKSNRSILLTGILIAILGSVSLLGWLISNLI